MSGFAGGTWGGMLVGGPIRTGVQADAGSNIPFQPLHLLWHPEHICRMLPSMMLLSRFIRGQTEAREKTVCFLTYQQTHLTSLSLHLLTGQNISYPMHLSAFEVVGMVLRVLRNANKQCVAAFCPRKGGPSMGTTYLIPQ
eukprot:1012866-Pelagomonas_calceolata.AAC.8